MAVDRADRIRVTGPLAAYASGFRADLAGQGYKSGRDLLTSMAHLSRWMSVRGLGIDDLTAEQVETFVTSAGRSGRRVSPSMRAIAPLVDHLVRVGAVLAGSPAVPSGPGARLIEDYRRYMDRERGLSTSTIRNYAAVARSFLLFVSRDDPVDVGILSAGVVTEFVMAEAHRGKVASAKAMTTRLRCFLRFLHIGGLTPFSLVGAVPSVAGWRGASLPKALRASEVSRLLDSCDRRRPVGRRDFAILMVLSRLGLRAGEVARLQLGDIDWRAGDMLVRGKGNRQDRLPMPVDVGEAIVGWLQRGRPPQCASHSRVRPVPRPAARPVQRGRLRRGVARL